MSGSAEELRDYIEHGLGPTSARIMCHPVLRSRSHAAWDVSKDWAIRVIGLLRLLTRCISISNFVNCQRHGSMSSVRTVKGAGLDERPQDVLSRVERQSIFGLLSISHSDFPSSPTSPSTQLSEQRRGRIAKQSPIFDRGKDRWYWESSTTHQHHQNKTANMEVSVLSSSPSEPQSRTFPQFKDFPLEIRQLIWEAALPGPRIITFELDIPHDGRCYGGGSVRR